MSMPASDGVCSNLMSWNVWDPVLFGCDQVFGGRGPNSEND